MMDGVRISDFAHQHPLLPAHGLAVLFQNGIAAQLARRPLIPRYPQSIERPLGLPVVGSDYRHPGWDLDHSDHAGHALDRGVIGRGELASGDGTVANCRVDHVSYFEIDAEDSRAV